MIADDDIRVVCRMMITVTPSLLTLSLGVAKRQLGEWGWIFYLCGGRGFCENNNVDHVVFGATFIHIFCYQKKIDMLNVNFDTD